MSHLIDMTRGVPAVAFVGQPPWHGLGKELTPDASIEEWRTESGLDYEVREAEVQYHSDGANYSYPDRRVLYRSDTKAPLSVVSNKYKPVQPGEVLEFFRDLVSMAGFQLETAGALADGKRIWALAKISEGIPIIGHDVVRPYLLLATSYDGTLATTGKLTAIRVVCWNTMSAATGSYSDGAYRKAEADTEGPVSTIVRVPHRDTFDEKAVKMQLGIYRNAFEKLIIESRLLANREVDLARARALTFNLMRSKGESLEDVSAKRGFQRVMDLFDGAAIGAEMAGPTLYGWVNAVTQFVDHERGRDSARLNSAWFGSGDAMKSHAFEMAKHVANLPSAKELIAA